MSLLDLLGITRIYHDGVEALTRKALNFTGGVTVTDDPLNGRTNIAISGGGGGGGPTYLHGDVGGDVDHTVLQAINGYGLDHTIPPSDGHVLRFLEPSGWQAAPLPAGGGEVAPLYRVYGPYHFENQRDAFGTPTDSWHFDAVNGPAWCKVNSGKAIIPLDAFLVHGRTLNEINVRVQPGTAGGGGSRMLAQLITYDVMSNYSGGAILAALYSDTTTAIQALSFAPDVLIDLTQYSYAVALYASGNAASNADAYYGGNVVTVPV